MNDVLAAIVEHPDERLRHVLTSAGISASFPRVRSTVIAVRDVTSVTTVSGRAASYDKARAWFLSNLNPESNTYDSNIWDIAQWGNTLFLTSGTRVGTPKGGDVDDFGFPMMYYDMIHKRFHADPKVGAFHFASFRRAPNGDLLFPAIYMNHDDVGIKRYPGKYVDDYYRYGASGWHAFYMPEVVHIYDVVDLGRITGSGDTIYTALGSFVRPGSIGISHDSGKTWKIIGVDDAQTLPANVIMDRALHLFQIGGRWYASMDGGRAVYWITGDHLVREHVDLFPGADNGDTESQIVERDVHIAGGTLYLGADNIYDHEWEPFGLYFASTIDRARAITLPVPDVIPHDIKVADGTAYVLGTKTLGRGKYANYVFVSRDARTWKTAFTFRTKALARSFAIIGAGREFYFGLGSLTDEHAPDSGLLLHLHL